MYLINTENHEQNPLEYKKNTQTYLILLKNNIENAQEKYPDCINTKSNNITFTQKGMLYADELIPSILL